MHVGVLAKMDLRHVVFPYIANDPDLREVRNGERVRRRQRLDTRLVGDLLVGNGSRYRSEDVHDAGRMIRVDSQQLKLFLRRFENHHVIVFGVLSDFLRAFRNRTVLEQSVGAGQLQFR